MQILEVQSAELENTDRAARSIERDSATVYRLESVLKCFFMYDMCPLARGTRDCYSLMDK